MALSFEQQLRDAASFARLTEPEWLSYLGALASGQPEPSELPALLKHLVALPGEAAQAGAPANERLRGEAFWSPLLQKLWRAVVADKTPQALTSDAVADVVRLYRELGSDSRARHHLLRLLAATEEHAALVAFAEVVASDPPREAQDILLAFVPLFQSKAFPPRALFPRLLDAMHDATLATVVLDLANYLTRSQKLAQHPAADRVERLGGLLGGVVGRLARLQEDPRQFATSADELNKMVSDSAGLIVALLHSLALIGDARVTGKLHQALELEHRRIRIEAAWALAKLGDEAGVQVLVQMAADPVVRPRAIAALEELGQLDKLA